MTPAIRKIAHILRAKEETLARLEQDMDAVTGKSGILDFLVQENEKRTTQMLQRIDGTNLTAEQIYESFKEYLERIDQRIYYLLGGPNLANRNDACNKMCEAARSLRNIGRGFFIKKEKAIALLEKSPPTNLLDHFGYVTVRELIEKQGFASIFSALRFTQDTPWMHSFFENAYAGLTAEDFEEREVELKVLEPQWLTVAEKFLEKKYHNVSHLKEFGIIYIIPIPIDTPGETLRMFLLLLHYLNEVPFYSRLFRRFSQESNFVFKLKSLLRGDVPTIPTINHQPLTGNWMIVQRYLAKDDANDPRLFVPHVNPEAEHWYLATQQISQLQEADLSQFHELHWTGKYFPTRDSTEELVSFDLVDLSMSLVKRGQIKYLYHQQEALWNQIFTEYLGRDRMNALIEKHIIEGFIPLDSRDFRL